MFNVFDSYYELSDVHGERSSSYVFMVEEAIGTETIDLEWVQVHPLLGEANPDKKINLVAFQVGQAKLR